MNPKLGIASKEKIEAVRELKSSEYQEYQKALAHLMRFSSDQQLFAIVRLNYDDYLNLVKQYLGGYAKNPSMYQGRMERMALDINRSILNFLSAVRTFLDHSETNLKKRYGKDSQKVKRFKKACSKAFDDNFSYRFLYKLRNYVQHCGMPLGTLDLHSKAVGPQPTDVHHSLSVRFNREKLLSEFDWGNRLAEEIQKLPLEFEISPHLTEMMKCIEMIMLTLVEDYSSELIQSAIYIRQLVKPIKDMPGVPCILKIKDLTGERKELNIQIRWIPLHLVEMVMRIAENTRA